MKLIARTVAVTLIAATLYQSSVLAVGGKKAEYIGGTVAGMPEKTEGALNTTDPTALKFLPDTRAALKIAIPYERITSIEYGQKAGRRVAVAVLVSPLALFSKKRKHFLTLTYSDANKEQAAVLEIGKDVIRTTLTIVQTRSGKEIEYQDDEARKAGRGGN